MTLVQWINYELNLLILLGISVFLEMNQCIFVKWFVSYFFYLIIIIWLINTLTLIEECWYSHNPRHAHAQVALNLRQNDLSNENTFPFESCQVLPLAVVHRCDEVLINCYRQSCFHSTSDISSHLVCNHLMFHYQLKVLYS